MQIIINILAVIGLIVVALLFYMLVIEEIIEAWKKSRYEYKVENMHERIRNKAKRWTFDNNNMDESAISFTMDFILEQKLLK